METKNIKLNNNEIRLILSKHYNINPIKIAQINRGTSDIFKIETQDKKYILKEFIEGRKKELILKEINIINILKKNNIKVPVYVKTIDNKYYTQKRNRIIVVQEFLEGYTIDNNKGDYYKTIESARILGKIVKALKNYKGLNEENIIEKSFSKSSLQKGIIKMEKLQQELKENNPYKSKCYKDLEDKIKIAKEIEKNFDFNIINKISILNSHGDYCSQQLIYNDNEKTAVIDFERAKKLPIVWEIIRSYSYIDKNVKNGEININTLVDYFKEFEKYIELNKYDLKYAPHIYIIQLTSSVFGYKEYNNNFEKEDLLKFGFFRTNLCKYIYQNIEEISLKLEKLKNE